MEDEQPVDPETTARLVEELTRANDRLERLESTLRDRGLLAAVQHRAESLDANSAAGPTSDLSGAGVREPPASVPARIAEAHFRRGVDLFQAGYYAEALAAWQVVIALQPDNVFALANIGIVFTEQERWQEARDIFVRVLSLRSDNAEAYYGLGLADAHLGNYPGAVAALENVLALNPDNPDARYNLALIRQRLAQQTAASGLPMGTTPRPIPVPERHAQAVGGSQLGHSTPAGETASHAVTALEAESLAAPLVVTTNPSRLRMVAGILLLIAIAAAAALLSNHFHLLGIHAQLL